MHHRWSQCERTQEFTEKKNERLSKKDYLLSLIQLRKVINCPLLYDEQVERILNIFIQFFKQTIQFIPALFSLTKVTISLKRNFKRCIEMITPLRCRWRQQKQGTMDHLPTKQIRKPQSVLKFTNLTKVRTNWLLLTCDNEISDAQLTSINSTIYYQLRFYFTTTNRWRKII